MLDVYRCGIRLGYIPEVADTRESQLVRAFVQLADTLVREFDLVEFLHLLTQRSTELLDVADAGLLLADTSGTLKVMASSSEETWALEVYQLQQHDGPCLDCYRTGERVIAPDLDADDGLVGADAHERGVAGDAVRVEPRDVVDGFDEIGLALPVGADERGRAGLEVELGLRVRPEVVQHEPGDVHELHGVGRVGIGGVEADLLGRLHGVTAELLAHGGHRLHGR